MVHCTRQARANVLLVAGIVVAAIGGAFAQQEPVATMFRDDLKRETALALSFLPIEHPAAAGAAPSLQIYLSAGDLERAFDKPQFRPDAVIVPTNTNLVITAASPSTQRVLIDRVMKQADVMSDLRDQIAARLEQSPASSGGDGGALQIGIDTLLVQLPRGSRATDSKGAFPRLACLIATDFAAGGAIDRRELFTQDRVRKGVAACLAALDAAGAGSVMLPLLGAGSAKTQSKDPVYEGQRQLKECRQLNAAAGVALGIHDFAPKRRAIREIGIVQWDQDITDMFRGSRLAQTAYRLYADQVKAAVNRGIAGEKTTSTHLDGACAATFAASS